jgi:hypothetical protein
MRVQRSFGPASFWISVDARIAKAEVEVYLQGQMVARETLTPEAATAQLNLLNGAAGVEGSLAVEFNGPGKRSVLLGDFVVKAGAGSTPYRGEIVNWIDPEKWLLKSEERWITPEIRAVADVSMGRDEAVEISFYAGDQIINTVTLSQGANDAVVTKGFQVGTVQIDAGLTLHLQPATPQQRGEVILDGNFSSSNLPHVHYAGAIVAWSYFPP